MVKRFFCVIILLTIIVWQWQPEVARASGSFFLSPPSASYTVGSTITTTLVVGTGGQAINAGQATVTYSTDTLEASGVSNGGSIFTLWPVQSAISGGQISFAGGVPTPGYTGNGGLVISMTFKAKAAGTATVSVSAGQLLLDDGLGTNILTGYGSATYTITEAAAVEEPTEPEEEEEEEEEEISVPSTPKILSGTHPDQETWYDNSNPEFSWDTIEGVTDFSYVFDDQADTEPDDQVEGPENSIKYTGTADGIWYFHVKVKNEAGWSETGHFKVQIDKTAPSDFQVMPQATELIGIKSLNVFFETTDATSSLYQYKVLVDGELIAVILPGEKTMSYLLENLDFGEHVITIQAFDKAGNMTESSATVKLIEHYPGTGFWLGPIYIVYSWLAISLLILLLLASVTIVFLFICCRRRKDKAEKKVERKRNKKDRK